MLCQLAFDCSHTNNAAFTVYWHHLHSVYRGCQCVRKLLSRVETMIAAQVPVGHLCLLSS